MPLAQPWLMVIDLQPAFSHPGSPWYTPALRTVRPAIERLVTAFNDRVLFTRFVPPAQAAGSWQAYYGRWSFAQRSDANWLWRLDAPWADREGVASHTFSKWVPEVRTRLDLHPTVVLCGVSTDCCVLMTALAAVDDGAHVRVVTDACAAKSPEVHAQALALMASRAPQLALVTVADELNGRPAVETRAHA